MRQNEMTKATLVRNSRLGDIPEMVYSAIEAELRLHRYAEPHGDARITRLELSYSAYGLHVSADVSVPVGPTAGAVASFYESGMDAIIAPPEWRDAIHALDIYL